MKMNEIIIGKNETIELTYNNNSPFITWMKNGSIYVKRPAFGAEEILIKCLIADIDIILELGEQEE